MTIHTKTCEHIQPGGCSLPTLKDSLLCSYHTAQARLGKPPEGRERNTECTSKLKAARSRKIGIKEAT